MTDERDKPKRPVRLDLFGERNVDDPDCPACKRLTEAMGAPAYCNAHFRRPE